VPGKREPLLLVVGRGDSSLTIYRSIGRGLFVLKTLPVGKDPRDVVVSPDGKRAYIASRGDHSVVVLDLLTFAVASTITSTDLKTPEDLAISHDGKTLYVVSSTRNSLFMISTDTNQVLKEIPTGQQIANRVTLSIDGRKAYVASKESRNIAVIDTGLRALSATIAMGYEPQGMSPTPDGKYLVVSHVHDDTVAAVDLTTNRMEWARGGVGLSPQRLVVRNDGQLAYVSGTVTGVISVLDLRDMRGRVIRNIPVGRRPLDPVINDAEGVLYVANSSDDTVSIIDLLVHEPFLTVPFPGKGPDSMAFRK
jgi:YVTN family beta-propeller protein